MEFNGNVGSTATELFSASGTTLNVQNHGSNGLWVRVGSKDAVHLSGFHVPAGLVLSITIDTGSRVTAAREAGDEGRVYATS